VLAVLLDRFTSSVFVLVGIVPPTGNGNEVVTAVSVETADFHNIVMPVASVVVLPSTYSVFAFSEPAMTLTGRPSDDVTGTRVETADFHSMTVPVGAVEVFPSTYCVPPPKESTCEPPLLKMPARI
jgi:hypothetical protein